MDDYKVGYRKPPKNKQFIKGQSGNPKGRPKGSRGVMAIVAAAGREKVAIRTNAGVRRVTKLEACVLQLLNQAMNGKGPAIRDYLHLHRASEEAEQGSTVPFPVDECDKAVLHNIAKRIRQIKDQPSTDAPSGEEKD